MPPLSKPARCWRIFAVGSVVTLMAAGFYALANGIGFQTVSSIQFVDLQEGPEPAAGFRRAHAKGICVAGYFESSGQLAALSRAELFEAGRVPLVGRFSIAGNQPRASDLSAPVRSLALRLGTGSHQWRMAMNTPPVMVARTPDDFFQFQLASKRDPLTGKPNPEHLAEYWSTHPEAAVLRAWQASYVPKSGFAAERYHSINTFWLVSHSGERHAVRWVMESSTQNLITTQVSTDKDALQQGLKQQLAQSPITFDWILIRAKQGDAVDDPTRSWPDDRPRYRAGQVVITHIPSDASVCEDLNFDPLVLPPGVMASSDPILRARSSAYAESYRRRAREQLWEALTW